MGTEKKLNNVFFSSNNFVFQTLEYAGQCFLVDNSSIKRIHFHTFAIVSVALKVPFSLEQDT